MELPIDRLVNKRCLVKFEFNCLTLPAVAAVSQRQHSWGHGKPAAYGDDARPIFGSTDRDGGRAFGCPKGESRPDSLASQQRHFLPEDLAGALKRLDDVEIDALLAAVTAEAERRGRRPPGPAKKKPVADAKTQRHQEAVEVSAGSLTTGKLNAVRAAFKAGVKPSAIARQFGISQSDGQEGIWTQGTRRAKDELVVARCGHQTCDFWFFANWLNSENLQRQSP